MGLNENYHNVRSNLLMRIPLPTLTEAYSVLIQEESQRSFVAHSTILGILDNHSSDTLSFLSRKNTYRSDTSTNDRRIWTCQHYKMKRHTMNFCWVLHPELKNKGRINTNGQSFSQSAFNSISSESDRRSIKGTDIQCHQEGYEASIGSSPSGNDTFTKDHYNQIVKFIGGSNTPSSSEPRASMVGISFSKNFKGYNVIDWILDTGSTNHMIHRHLLEVARDLNL